MELTKEQLDVLWDIKTNYGISFKQMADDIGINYSFFNNIRHGRKKLPLKYLDSFNQYILTKGVKDEC